MVTSQLAFRNFSSFTVDWFDEDDSYSTTADITSDVKSIPLFTDTGTGEVNSATIILRALDGNYLLDTQTPTRIEEFDRIRIRCTDLGSNSYDRYFEVINIIPSQTKGEGTLLTLECLGIEYHTQQIHMVKPYWFENSFNVGHSVGTFYEANRGTKQPVLDKHGIVFTSGNGFGSALPFFNANNWEFGINEDSCYNRWMDLLEGAGAAVDAGGALTFYELNFLTTGVNAINFKLRKSGDNSTIVQVLNSVTTGVKVGEQEGMLTNPTGSNLLAWGSPEHGSLPVDFSKYDSGLMQFVFRPEWVTGTVYDQDTIIKRTPTTGTTAPKHYKATSDHTSSGTNEPEDVGAPWTQIDMGTFGDSIQYSPWTDGKAALWGNSGCDPERLIFTNGGWFDINVVVNEESYFRTWVDARASTDANLNTLDNNWSYIVGNNAKFPRGFRVLVDADSPTGDLSAFPNMVVMWDDSPNLPREGEWIKLYNFESGNDNAQVAVLDEGKIYEFDSATTAWASVESDRYGNDCFHQYTTAPAETDGVDLVFDKAASLYKTRSEVTDSTERPDITSGGGEFGQNQESGISFIAAAAKTELSGSDAHDELDPWNTATVGFNFRFPFPCNTFNSITEKVGELYGGGAADWVTTTAYVVDDKVHESGNLYNCIVAHTSGIFATDLTAEKWIILVGQEPSTMDIQNMAFTHDGQQGFNATGSAQEDYGQISAVAFWLNFSVVGGGNELNDEHRFRAWFVDLHDNVVYQDFVVRFSLNWEDIRLPIAGFKIYKGRKPLRAIEKPIADLIPVKELEIINIFEWRNIKIFGVQYQPQYDKFGRYNPQKATVDEAGNSVTWGNITAATRTLKLDGFRFIKPLLVTSGRNSTRNLEPDFLQLPNITVYDQLLNAAKSQLEIEKFIHKEYNVESSGDEIFDILFGEAFHLKNDEIINDDDLGGENNNIKIVAKRIEYSITKPPGGKGGLRRKIKGSKIFT